MFGGNDQPPPPPSAPLQKVETTPTETTNLATTGADTQKVAGQLEANTAKPGALATPSGDTETNKSLLGT